MLEKENDENLLRAYEASYGAIRGINLQDFKNMVHKSNPDLSSKDETVEEIEKRVEDYLENYRWEAV